MGFIVDKVNKVLSVDIHEAESIFFDEISYLAKVLYRREVGNCGNCAIETYIALNKNGLELAIMKEKEIKRTCVPAWNGERYVRRINGHISSKHINDQEAILYLKDGILLEKDFTTLPEGYGEEKPAPKQRKRKRK